VSLRVESRDTRFMRALADQCVLAHLEMCMEGEAAMAGLPQRLGNLLDRSRRLFIRVARLDELARRRVD
jgi:hypothetical protein